MASTKGLPVEIFLQVYGYLGPKDFNAARCTCRAWLKASLDKNLLTVMIERGGWAGVDTSREWQLLSCQLARECALAPGRAGLETEPVFTKSSEVDFAGLRDSQPGGELIFTTSICSRFLCVAQGALIYIYQLDAGRLVYMASVECPGQVLAITMGLYGGRYAIAAILEDRMGMVRKLPEELFEHGPQGQEQDRTQFNAIHIQSNSERISITGTNNSALYEHNLINQMWNSIDNDSTIYSDLGFEGDPPRSVSLCPQSQCVVFGCSAGLDVQWIDEPSGQSLHRWFPLTAPSDNVYVLPTRTGHESSNTLRIFSSPAHLDDRPRIKHRLLLSDYIYLWGSHRFIHTSLLPNSIICDYYNVIPLSDGHHILFVDPPSDRLVLGTDELASGTTELVRKIEFIPPTNGQRPRLYRVAADMSEGARLVAVYGDIIMLYSIPPEICRFSPNNEDQTDRPLQHGSNHWLDWWDEPRANEETAALHDQGPAWPLSLRDAPMPFYFGGYGCGEVPSLEISKDQGGIWGGEDGGMSQGAR
ncbi:hypothetical protein GGP41_002625 [Bipolaris sorokiniana]|uniref:F-box domain-containing protein n=1 Tax=Cochliobolus sativus TaxID=45130 RepID=A0A8H6DVX4_COCSA|nr:hypothetical protein GGP41_002625 [Bipolaris sorokiniana]